MLPLEGIRILDLTNLSGYCGMELADHGAEVIKVEMPRVGDPLRALEPLKDGVGAHHLFRDRGKKSVTLDITSETGKEIFRKLVETADGIIENFAPGTMEALGLGYDALSEIKPSLVYGRLTAYGSKGEGKDIPQNDLIAQAKTGCMYVTGFPENEPTRIGFSLSEHYAASFLTSGMCVAIYAAKNTGLGQVVETSLLGSALAVTEDKVITYGVTKEDPMRTGNAHPLINPYDIIKCKNGYVAMGISSDDQWGKFCKVFDRVEWTEDEKYCSNFVRGLHYFGDLRDKIEELFADYTMQEISEACDSVLIPGTMCSTTREAIEDPQLHVRNMILDIDGMEMPGRPVKFLGEEECEIKPAPILGENNSEIFSTIGIDKVKLMQLKSERVI